MSQEATFPVRLAESCGMALFETAERLAGMGHSVTDVDPEFGFLAPAFIPRYLRSARDSAVRLVDPQLLAPAARLPARLGQLISPERVTQSRLRGQQWTSDITERVFSHADVLLTPVLPGPADAASHFHAGRPLRSAIRSSMRSAYTTAWYVAGFPAASVPAGFSADGLPLAIQLIALPGKERTLIALAAQLQDAADWTVRRPPV